MRVAGLFGIFCLATAAAAATPELPRFDVEQACSAFVGSNDPKAPMRNLCIAREQRAYQAGQVLWSSGTDAERTKCRSLAERSRSYKYVYLATCLRSSARTRALGAPRNFQY